MRDDVRLFSSCALLSETILLNAKVFLGRRTQNIPTLIIYLNLSLRLRYSVDIGPDLVLFFVLTFVVLIFGVVVLKFVIVFVLVCILCISVCISVFILWQFFLQYFCWCLFTITVRAG